MSKKTKPIKKIVQLVTQANDCGLLPRLNFQDAFSEAISTAGETNKSIPDARDIFDRLTTRTIYVLKDGRADYFVGKKDKRIISYVQKTKLSFINEDGNSHKWKSPISKRLYLEFINLKTKEALDKFVQKRGFCIFPSRAEAIKLSKKYGKGRPEFLVGNGIKIPEKLIDTMNLYKMDIVRDNLKFIWQKKLELEKIVQDYSNGKLEYYRLHAINEQMENVSEILFNKTNKLLDEIKEGIEKAKEPEVETKIATDNRTLEEIVGMETIKQFSIIPAFRIYGHYAYCFLEFYLDILKNNKIMICKNCWQYNHIKQGENFDRKFCTKEESPICFKEKATERKQNQRKKERLK